MRRRSQSESAGGEAQMNRSLNSGVYRSLSKRKLRLLCVVLAFSFITYLFICECITFFGSVGSTAGKLKVETVFGDEVVRNVNILKQELPAALWKTYGITAGRTTSTTCVCLSFDVVDYM
jgi:hypothetical protein